MIGFHDDDGGISLFVGDRIGNVEFLKLVF